MVGLCCLAFGSVFVTHDWLLNCVATNALTRERAYGRRWRTQVCDDSLTELLRGHESTKLPRRHVEPSGAEGVAVLKRLPSGVVRWELFRVCRLAEELIECISYKGSMIVFLNACSLLWRAAASGSRAQPPAPYA